jgi:hypothetical protein
MYCMSNGIRPFSPNANPMVSTAVRPTKPTAYRTANRDAVIEEMIVAP